MAMPKVLVTCHNPTVLPQQGDIKWEGHDIAQYVDVTRVGECKKTKDRGKYACGWDELAQLHKPGTFDKVFAPFCPIAQQLSKDTPFPQPLDFTKGIDKDLFVTAVSYLKPGGVLLIPWDDGEISDKAREALEAQFGAETLKIAPLEGAVPTRSPAKKADLDEFKKMFLQITKRAVPTQQAVSTGRNYTAVFQLLGIGEYGNSTTKMFPDVPGMDEAAFAKFKRVLAATYPGTLDETTMLFTTSAEVKLADPKYAPYGYIKVPNVFGTKEQKDRLDAVYTIEDREDFNQGRISLHPIKTGGRRRKTHRRRKTRRYSRSSARRASRI
jgi:hypothetical protein